MHYPAINWLDLGCGTGTMSDKAQKIFTDVSFTMVDPSPQMIEQAKTKTAHTNSTYICSGSEGIDFENEFDVVTAIQSHHYFHEDTRKTANENVYRALKDGGIYIYFENVIPECPEVKSFELQRWGSYQLAHGKTEKAVQEHIARCGVNYFPITVKQHIELLQEIGFTNVHVFWYSYMQMGIYAIKKNGKL